jgi:hypothetical protein
MWMWMWMVENADCGQTKDTYIVHTVLERYTILLSEERENQRQEVWS